MKNVFITSVPGFLAMAHFFVNENHLYNTCTLFSPL